MTRSAAIGLVLGLLGLAVVLAVAMPPIPQDPAYHRLADGRALLRVPNALNVLSNAPFALVGIAGLWVARPGGAARFLDRRDRWPWLLFFAGLALTGVGSAYYHLEPGNARLTWDRLPLSLALMGLFAGVIAERIGPRVGAALLGPLAVIGLASVLWWHAGEVQGRGDLRPYALVQFYPLLAVPLMLWLFPARYTRCGAVLAMVGIYAFAKVFELLDAGIYRSGHVVSGHTLKHLAAGAAGAIVVWMLVRREPAAGAGPAVR